MQQDVGAGNQNTINYMIHDNRLKRWKQFQEIDQIKNPEQRAIARVILKNNMPQEDINVDYFENQI